MGNGHPRDDLLAARPQGQWLLDLSGVVVAPLPVPNAISLFGFPGKQRCSENQSLTLEVHSDCSIQLVG